MKTPRTLQEAIIYFSDADRAFDYACKLRWPDGKIICPRCRSEKHYPITTKTKKGLVRRLWLCRNCEKQFTLKVNTILEDSPLGLDKWMTAFWMLVNCKNGVSSVEIAATLGITQKAAWFTLQRLRLALHQGGFTIRTKIGGEGNELEADETFVGGLTKNMHKGRRTEVEGRGPLQNKTIVHGILDWNLRQVRATAVPNVKRETLQDEIFKNVKYGSTIYTDSAVAYDNGLQRRFVHDFVNKTEGHVKGRVHTNGMENFWSLMKRSLKGTYVAVEPFHLFRYVDEQVFRYNNRKAGGRKLTDSERFANAMALVAGKSITYADLTGKNESPRPAPMGTGEAQPIAEPF